MNRAWVHSPESRASAAKVNWARRGGAVLLGLALFVLGLRADSPRPTVEVCSEDSVPVEPGVYFKAKWVTAQIFKQAGIQVRWSICRTKKESIRIRFAHDTPADAAPHAYGYALPYEGRTIVLFSGRIISVSACVRAEVLGHVMAHEIAHLLKGVASHSASGLLKERFTLQEQYRMGYEPLLLAPGDVDLIHSAMQTRASDPVWRARASQ